MQSRKGESLNYKQGGTMHTLLADRLYKAERRRDRPALIARHVRTALECIVGLALVIGGNVVAWYWLIMYVVKGGK